MIGSSSTETLVAFGEVLWDCLPRGLFLGGAPFNVAFHAAKLGAKAYPATSAGRDFLGDQVTDRARDAGLQLDMIHRHPYLTTGVAIAQLDNAGNAKYDIRQPVAWDQIELTDEQYTIVDQAGAFVYGSLATRSESNCITLDRLLESSAKLKICDVNLRAPYDDPGRAKRYASKADIVKLNDEELFILAGLDQGEENFERALEICQDELGVPTLCVTRGGDGAVIWDDGKLLKAEAKPIKVADTIGAGDSFTAALSVFAMRGHSYEDSLQKAVQLGAFVASKDGAQPDYEADSIFA